MGLVAASCHLFSFYVIWYYGCQNGEDRYGGRDAGNPAANDAEVGSDRRMDSGSQNAGRDAL